MPDPTRVGSVAYNRAHGLNKAAGGPGKTGGGGGGNKPKPSGGGGGGSSSKPSGGGGGGGSRGGGGGPKPTPYTGSKPSGGGGGGAGPRVGSVAYNRLHGLNKAAGGPGKAGPSDFKPAHQQAKSKAQVFGAGANNATGGGAAKSSDPNDLSQYGTGLQGYANWWNSVGKQQGIDAEKEYAANNPLSGLAGMEHHNISLTENGLFDWDSTKPINGLNVKMMKQFGIKGGDQIFDPAKIKSINEPEGAQHDGTLDAHWYEFGLALPVDWGSSGSYGEDHKKQMEWNQQMADADGTTLGDASHLFQDKYSVGRSEGYEGDNFVGSDHHESINQALTGWKQYAEKTGKDGGIKAGINDYIRDGGYAGDALKILEGHKQNLTSEQDIKWYNSLIKQAEGYDWEKKNSTAGPQGGYYDVRAGGRAQGYEDGGALTKAGGVHDAARSQAINSGGYGSQSNDFQSATQGQQQNQFNQQNMQNFDYMQFMPGARGSRFQEYTFDPMKFMQGQ